MISSARRKLPEQYLKSIEEFSLGIIVDDGDLAHSPLEFVLVVRADESFDISVGA